jgi:hypothetical protein
VAQGVARVGLRAVATAARQRHQLPLFPAGLLDALLA